MTTQWRRGLGSGRTTTEELEIVSYVLDGALQCRDSMGNGSVLRAGDIQRMSARTGVTHSDFNHSPDEPLHLLQIWLLPAIWRLEPSYEERRFAGAEKRGRLRFIVSPDGREGSLTMNQEVRICCAVLGSGDSVAHTFAAGRHVWRHIALGRVQLDRHRLNAGTRSPLAVRDLSCWRAILAAGLKCCCSISPETAPGVPGAASGIEVGCRDRDLSRPG